MEKLEPDLESFVRLCHLYEKVEKLEQALAEKDRELREYKSAADADLQIGEQQCDELTQRLVEKEREITHLQDVYIKKRHKQEDAYQQIMDKAVRFANYIKDEFTYGNDPRFIEADEFLASPEVQVWKERET